MQYFSSIYTSEGISGAASEYINRLKHKINS